MLRGMSGSVSAEPSLTLFMDCIFKVIFLVRGLFCELLLSGISRGGSGIS